jgi:hypothetical protein
MLKKITLAMALTLACSSLHAEPAKKDNIHMFPQAKEGIVIVHDTIVINIMYNKVTSTITPL